MPTERLTKRLAVRPVRALADNYIWLIESPRTHSVVVVDPGEAAPVIAELKRSGLSLAAILLTHHHLDHIAGVPELLAIAPVPVFGPNDDRIPFLTQSLADGARAELPALGLEFQALHVAGHTLSHIAYLGHDTLFCGDTLFSAGCGRLFEGTPQQMDASLTRLRGLPPHTRVYCGHEYTAANLRFALAVEPDNQDTIQYRDRVSELRAGGQPSLPSTLSLEIKVNPFLRCGEPTVRRAVAHQSGTGAQASQAEIFGALRAWKDGFT